MGRVRQLKRVLRYFIQTKRPGFNGDYYWGARKWIGEVFKCTDALLFEDKDEAERFLIQRKLSSGDAFWQDAEVCEEWMNL